jgi:uncharacterized SAM-binding protein YcdF (DUF218 family)
MFFIISKLYSFLLTPFIWLFILLLIKLLTKNNKKLKKLILITFCVFIFFSNDFISREFVRIWEYKITPDDRLSKSYDVGVVLGGGMVTIDTKNKRITFRNNTDRILQAIALYKEGRIKKMLLSSGSGSLVEKYQNEARIIKPYLIEIGIPEKDILTDTLSNNTRQNAVESAKILSKEYPKGKFLLITSAMHMRRAMGCFRKVGLDVSAYATNVETGPRKYYFDTLFIPNIEALGAWSGLSHEVFGYLSYAIMGYI